MLSKAYNATLHLLQTICKQQLSTIYTIHTGTSEENNIKFGNLNFATVHLKRPYNCGKTEDEGFPYCLQNV